MKKTYLIPCLLIAFFTAFSLPEAQAQFGLRAGINFANLNNVDGVDLESRTGIMVGGYYNVSLPASPVSIQPEITYNQKGAEEGGVKIKLDYLEIPALAKFKLSPGPISPNLYAGPYLGIVLNSEVEGDGISAEIDNTQTDFGGIVGAGIDIDAGVTSLNLGVRYGFGFSDTFEGGSEKNAAFSIVGGISL